MVEKEKTEKQSAKFLKEQILSSKQYAERKDLLEAILEDGKEYSNKEIEQKIQQFMKGTVK